MNVSEIENLAPLSSTFEIDPNAQYVVFVDRTVARDTVAGIAKRVKNSTIFMVHDVAAVRILKLEQENP